MGGLKPYLPITYWTFLIGALAIAGVPLLSGFFSKDEILYETFREGHTLLWLIAAVTSLLTATYMFRLVFLTFHGERRDGAMATDDQAGADSHQGGANSHQVGANSHGVGPISHLHDAPAAMALVLVMLAIGSALAGYIGVPHALGGQNQLAVWLAPSFQPPATAATAATVAGGLQPSGEPEAAAEEAPLELALMGVSSAVAIAGIWLAAFIWLRRRELAASLARSYPGLHRLLLNKYYVDEVYEATLVQPIRVGSDRGLWRGFDVAVVDGAVNGTATIVAVGAAVLRRLQTGSVRAYAGSMFIGVIVMLGYYLWR